ncbi:hypothetical protein AAIP42_001007 [Flavobacterium psychrophilum]|nr:hypothetical protein [Flavobacterium psychrophilum]
MKRVLLHENSNLLGEISSDLNQYLPLLKEVKMSYENLELGDFTNEIFKELLSTGTNGIDIRFTEHLKKQIEKLEVTSSVLKENLLNGSKTLFQDFANKVSLLKRFKPDTFSRTNYLKLNFISYQNIGFYLSDENKEQILENECRVYLDNEKEVELYENLKQFIEAYNKVSENLNELQFSFSYNQGKGIKAIENVFLELKENSFDIVPGSIKFATNYNENRLKFNS